MLAGFREWHVPADDVFDMKSFFDDFDNAHSLPLKFAPLSPRWGVAVDFDFDAFLYCVPGNTKGEDPGLLPSPPLSFS